MKDARITRRQLLAGALASTAFAQSKTVFYAGAAKRDITPDPLLPISGGMGTPTPAKSRQGDLTVRAMVFRSGAETDLRWPVSTFWAIPPCSAITHAGCLGLAPTSILIGSTHTHSAPDCYAYPDGKGGHTGSLPYMEFVAQQAAAAINEALDHLQPAELRIASGDAKGKIAYNYYAPDLYDRAASVLQVRAANGQPIGTLVNYAIHPEVMGNAQGILSPDSSDRYTTASNRQLEASHCS